MAGRKSVNRVRWGFVLLEWMTIATDVPSFGMEPATRQMRRAPGDASQRKLRRVIHVDLSIRVSAVVIYEFIREIRKSTSVGGAK